MLETFSSFLFNAKNIVYLTWTGRRIPEVSTSVVRVYSWNGSQEWVVSFEELPRMVHLLKTIASEKKLIVIFYDVKPMLSYVGWSLDKQKLSPHVAALPDSSNDLRLREKFLGIDKPIPLSCNEAAKRLAECQKGRVVYQKVYKPLLSVVASMERSGVIKENKIVYPFYEIEGQANGRLNCSSPSENNYNPHLLDEETKKTLRPVGYDRNFVVADFKALEFVVLAHISNDENMIFDAKADDPYLAALRRMFGKDDIDSEYRKVAKDIFLPVFYGKTPPVLARDLNCTEETAQKIHREVKLMYPKAAEMVITAERIAHEKGFCEDVLGRKRYFSENFWAARNMVVQSPSAIFCQEKLVYMFYAVKGTGIVNASIHDGFLFSCKNLDLKELVKYIKISLESESEIIPGLKAKVRISYGSRLDNLTEIGDTVFN